MSNATRLGKTPVGAGSPRPSPTLATAILVRLPHFSTAINVRGRSFRLREKRKAGIFTDLADLQKDA